MRDAANFIMASIHEDTTSPPPTVGRDWVARFLKRHNYNCVSQKTLKRERQLSEDIAAINDWYLKLREVIAEEGIHDNDI